ncbi:MAG TPA: DUF5654 family protein [Candidatus Nanoarchaeia archaeon]|nr:DUF5654 family protein [Candidatus Nanoarchaeia archaeon]
MIRKPHRSFKTEFKRQLRFAITAAIGFSIAFAWRNAIFDTFQTAVGRFLDLPLNNPTTEIYTALFITFVALLLLYVTSKLLKK